MIIGGKWTTYRQMAEETIDTAIKSFNLSPSIDHCPTRKIRLVGAEYWSETLYINLVQQFGIDTDVAKHLCESYGDRAYLVASTAEVTGRRWPVRGTRIADNYPYIESEIRYAVREEYAQTAVDVLARRLRLAFLNAQASLDALPRVIDIMAQELKWDTRRREREWRDGVDFLLGMGLPASREGITREEVVAGKTVSIQSS